MSWMPELSDRRQRQVLGVLLLALAGLLVASLATFKEPPPGSRPWVEANASGPLGAWLAFTLNGVFGRLAAWGIPILALAFGWNRLRDQPLRPLIIRTVVLSVLTVELLAVIGLIGSGALAWSGSLGAGMAALSQSLLGTAGSAIALVALFLITALVASELGFSAISIAWAYVIRDPLKSLGENVKIVAGEQLEGWKERRQKMQREDPPSGVRAEDSRAEKRGRRATQVEEEPVRRPAEVKRPAMAMEQPLLALPEPGEAPSPRDRAARERAPVRVKKIEKEHAGAVGKSEPAKKSAIPEPVLHSGDLPSLDLLEQQPKVNFKVEEADLQAEADLLTSRLADFSIRGRVTEVHPGPVVTTYEFEPAPGVKVNQITSRDTDLALAMRANRIRIQAPIPGKGAVGVEIPNRKTRTVYFREVLGSEAYRRLPAKLKIVLGVDVNGNPAGADLTTMPHLLVAGATGAGKSVYLNVLITSLLFEKGPDDLRLLMIDPKMIELTAYNGIPHLLMPVITDAKKAARSLRWAVGEMERRYKLLARTGARIIDSYNKKVRGPSPPVDDDGNPLEALSYVVIIVDELADLMLTVAADVEEPIGRLAQMARAVGIHLVLATQRPSVDVLTGVIKANFPSRLAFQVSSKTDSRTILDMNGAENLLGKGDMLYLPAGQAQPLRVHGPFASETDISQVVDFWRERAPKESGPSNIEEAVERAAETVDEDEDNLIPDAVRLVVLHQQGSTSLLQRRLKVGYSRASRLMDRLESLGVVGPFTGSKAREVLVDESYLEEHSLQ